MERAFGLYFLITNYELWSAGFGGADIQTSPANLEDKY